MKALYGAPGPTPRNLEPSPEDIRITKKLVEAGKLLDIRVLDHLIVGHDGQYTSLAERGLIA